MAKGGTTTVRVIAACVLLILLALMAACGPEPATPTPTAVPTPTTVPTPRPTATMSPTPTATPSPTVVPLLSLLKPLRPDPLVLARTTDLTEALRVVANGTYCTPAWTASTFPASLALPVDTASNELLLEWNSSGTSDYINLPGEPSYGLPASYTISTSADSTDGKNGTWQQVVSVTGNTVRTRAHRFPFAGAHWVRMTVTAAVPGPLGKRFAIDQIELHDASQGTDDTFFFLGDSITAAAFTRCPANQPSFAELVRRSLPGRFPAMINGGVGGVNSGYGVSVIQDWLALNPDFYVWAIGYGTNDAWQKVSPEVFDANLQTLVNRIEAAGRVPVIARIPFAAKGPADADVQALNQVIDAVTSRNGLPPGPNLYGWFSQHPDELGPDGVHPTEAGTRSINRLWYDALRPLYGTKP